MTEKKKKRVPYVNNKKLYGEMLHYITTLHNLKDGDEPPRMPNYVGEAIYKIAYNLIKRPNFSGYSQHYREEMISDAILDCVAGVDNYNVDYRNPHAYFTKIAWNAFIRRIGRESTQVYYKHKNFELMSTLDPLSYAGGRADYNGPYNNRQGIHTVSSDIVEAYETKNSRAKKKFTKDRGCDIKKGVEVFASE